MSIRTTFLPSILRSYRSSTSTTISSRAFHFLPSSPPPPSPKTTPFRSQLPFARQQPQIIAKTRAYPRRKSSQAQANSFLFALGIGATFVGISSLRTPPARSEPLSSSSGPRPEIGGGQPQPPAESILSVYQLSFGAVCGICTGVFVKKGLRAIAFLLGGVFILLQYLSTKRFITVDWSKVAGRYDTAFGTKTPTGEQRSPTVGGVWAWFVDFVTANFQQRATFLAGLALGIRLG
ncbi:FUN14 family-domain-containing protein [Naematelia encephala]|uniref:FUN14 family-domain-containing protein n=1 Tax=Naematelia encephala TaxID=71784 RepID=A0A1Y2B5H0_9TREE|nr:FUN14 family-domain-containing protein [Naematelia encephala]